jgi:hypothetical protein
MPTADRSWTLVWIDSRGAIIVGWQDGPVVQRVELDTPPHERSVGHVRHDPVRHGGGRSQARLETHRLEHLRQGLERVAAAIPPDENALVIGPGTVRERLSARLEEEDARRPATEVREIRTEPARRMTEPQLVERLRELVGEPPLRIRPAGGPPPARA